jgi:hypothetical protein
MDETVLTYIAVLREQIRRPLAAAATSADDDDDDDD